MIWTVDEQYNYGWAVPFLCAYLFWKRFEGWTTRTQDHGTTGRTSPLLPSSPRPVVSSPVVSSPVVSSFHGLVVLLSCGLVVLFLGTRLVEEANPDWRLIGWALALEVIALSLIAVHLWHGAAGLKHFAFPILFILVAVPWPTPVEHSLVQLLTRGIVAVTVELLNAFGLAAVPHGNVIETVGGFVDIDEACSGIRSLQAALMLALFFGEWRRLNGARRVALVGVSFALACLFNLARTLTLSLVAAKQGSAAVARWHDPAGVTILLGCFCGVWLAAEWLARKNSPQRCRDAEEVEKNDAITPVPIPLPPDATLSPLTPALTPTPNPSIPPGARDSVEPSPVQSSEFPANGSPSSVLSPPPSDFVPPSRGPVVPKSISMARLSAFGLLLLAGEIGIRLWYASAPRVVTAEWRAEFPRSASSFKVVALPDAAQKILRYDEGESASWLEPDGTRWQMIYLRWQPGRVAATLARNHTPEVCLPAAGKSLRGQSEISGVKAGNLALGFRCFVTEQQGRPLHVFYSLWEDGVAEQRQATEMLTRSARLEAVRDRRRNRGQRVLQVAVWGARDTAHAEELLRAELPKLIQSAQAETLKN